MGYKGYTHLFPIGNRSSTKLALFFKDISLVASLFDSKILAMVMKLNGALANMLFATIGEAIMGLLHTIAGHLGGQ